MFLLTGHEGKIKMNSAMKLNFSEVLSFDILLEDMKVDQQLMNNLLCVEKLIKELKTSISTEYGEKTWPIKIINYFL